MSDLPKRLRIKASMIALGERIAWGSDTALMEEAADAIEALSASVENHQLHMLGIARDRDQLRALLTAQPQASDKVPCKTHPDAPHGFCRNSSHTEGRYVCECEHWEEPQASADDSRKLSDLGNELHNLSCHVVHVNEGWAEQIGKIACELWKWPQARAAQPAPVVQRIEALEKKHGSLRAAANACGIDPGYLCRLKNSEKMNPSDEVLSALGLERVIYYRDKQIGGEV